MNPFPIILSSPSGGGKTTITRMLRERRVDVGYSVSCTTRPPRRNEVDGTDYFFLQPDEFLARRARGEFAESAEVHGNWYGTLRSEVSRVLGQGLHVLMDIDVHGARQFATAYPESVLVFLLPPSAGALLERLSGRRTEGRGELLRRLQGAREELRSAVSYQYIVVNDDLERAYEGVSSIVDAEAVRHQRLSGLTMQIQALVEELDRQIRDLSSNTRE